MTTIVRVIKPLLMLTVAAICFSCNDNAAPKEDAEKMADTVASDTVAPAPASLTPFNVVEILHEVKDYAKWKAVFDADSTARRAAGIKDMVLAKSVDNPNNVLIILIASDVQKAKSFADDPRLKDVMSKGGVVSKPRVEYFNVIRLDTNAKEKTWVEVTHKVKDFDAWVKVFDEEGPAKRAEQGLFDAVLARGTDDPNNVRIIFDVKDIARAKATIASEEKKKLMMSAGVEGVPTVEFYKSAE